MYAYIPIFLWLTLKGLIHAGFGEDDNADKKTETKPIVMIYMSKCSGISLLFVTKCYKRWQSFFDRKIPQIYDKTCSQSLIVSSCAGTLATIGFYSSIRPCIGISIKK